MTHHSFDMTYLVASFGIVAVNVLEKIQSVPQFISSWGQAAIILLTIWYMIRKIKRQSK